MITAIQWLVNCPDVVRCPCVTSLVNITLANGQAFTGTKSRVDKERYLAENVENRTAARQEVGTTSSVSRRLVLERTQLLDRVRCFGGDNELRFVSSVRRASVGDDLATSAAHAHTHTPICMFRVKRRRRWLISKSSFSRHCVSRIRDTM